MHADRDAPHAGSINTELDAANGSDVPSPSPLTSEPMAYLYTSGTTGMPKAAVVTNQRFLAASYGLGKVMHDANPDDVIYVALPGFITAPGSGVASARALGNGCHAGTPPQVSLLRELLVGRRALSCDPDDVHRRGSAGTCSSSRSLSTKSVTSSAWRWATASDQTCGHISRGASGSR